ncbi:MAG: hypothetical protein U9N59_13335 [Campylobacterota bacterium]|nr:hypothetical protein [Campylobacterota bacterium]
MSQHKFNLEKLSDYKKIGFLTLISFIILLYSIDFSEYIKWLYGKHSYMKLDEATFGILYRIIYYILSFIIGLSFLMIVPKRELFFTSRGTQTMNIYVWHCIFLDILTSSGFYTLVKELIGTNHILMFIFFILLAIGIVFVLSSKFVEKYFSIHKLSVIKILKK